MQAQSNVTRVLQYEIGFAEGFLVEGLGSQNSINAAGVTL